MAVTEQIEALLKEHVGLTDHQLSEHIFGVPVYHQFVSEMCDRLVHQGRLCRKPSQSGQRQWTYSPR